VEIECRQSVTLDSGLDSIDIDDRSGIRDAMVARVREELRGLDLQLVVHLAQCLHLSGYASTLMDASPTMIENRHLPLSHVPQEGARTPPPSLEMETGRDTMDGNP
jgi:hypothetical protein